MDTSSYLRSQGWLGTGHALNSHKPGLGLDAGQRAPGLAKPLIIPQKQNVFGVGKKKHDSHADQWWARAFDDVLKGVNGGIESAKTSPNGEVEVKVEERPRTNMISMRMGALGKHGNLYGNFVRGEGLRGTFLRAEEEEVVEVMTGDRGRSGQIEREDKRRKISGTSEVEVPVEEMKHAEQVVVPEGGVADAPATPKADVGESVFLNEERAETKAQQRQRQRERKARDAAIEEQSVCLNGRSAETKEQRRQRREDRSLKKIAKAAGLQVPHGSTREELIILIEDGTERKEQRKQRREERRARKAAEEESPQVARKSIVEEPIIPGGEGAETKAQRRQRREERRARKATEAEVAARQAVQNAVPVKELGNDKASNISPNGRAHEGLVMTDEPNVAALKREMRVRREKKKKKRRKGEQSD